MNKFRNTNDKARELYELVEDKLSEAEKATFNLRLNNLIHSTVLDVTNAENKVTESMLDESKRLYKYE